MKNFVCWQVENFSETLATDADRMTSATFMAVHTPMQLRRTEIQKQSGEKGHVYLEAGVLTEADVLSDFLDPSRDFVLMPVLGEVGSGKSHLVRWLSENITDDGGARRVVRVPRTSNVRRVLLDMLEGLEDEFVAEVRKEVERSRAQLTPEAARMDLLNNLSFYAGPASIEPPEIRTREEKIAAKYAETILLEPKIREQLLEEGGVIDCVAQGALSARDSTPGEERKTEFTLGDLPLELSDRDLDSLGDDQRIALEKCRKQSVREGLIRYLNGALRPAARRLLNFQDSSQLEELFERVRRELGRQGKELILLIEDLVSMSSIADPLLELAKRRPKKDSEHPLCPIRTVVACTTGRFNMYVETLQSRVEPYIVTTRFDVGTIEAGEYVAELTGRYLNVTRVPPDHLRDWFRENREKPKAPPNACDSCQYRESCHPAFGSVLAEDVGLYPFNRRALGRIAEVAMGRGVFNPRFLIKNGIEKFLRRASRELETGEFPSGEVRRSFRVDGLPPQDELLLRRLHGPALADRLNSLITLWGHGKSEQVHEAVARSFGVPEGSLEVALPRPGTGKAHAPPTPKPDQSEPAVGKSEADEAVAEWPPTSGPKAGAVAALRSWRDQKSRLGQSHLKELREALHPWMVDSIPWASMLLVPTELAARTGSDSILQGASLNFQGQTAKVRAGLDLVLMIPPEDGDDPRLRAAVALEAVLRSSHEGGWSFPDGDRALASVLNYVDELSEHAMNLIDARYGPRAEGGDPLGPVVSLLWLAGHLVGRALPIGANLADKIEFILTQPPQGDLADACPPSRSAAWSARLKYFAGKEGGWSEWAHLREVLLWHVSARKGRTGGPISLDSARIAPLLKDSELSRPFGEGPFVLPNNGGFRRVQKLLDRVRGPDGAALRDVAFKEASGLVAVLIAARQFLGENPDFEAVCDDGQRVSKALSAAVASRDDMRVKSEVSNLLRFRTGLASQWRRMSALDLDAEAMQLVRGAAWVDPGAAAGLASFCSTLAEVLSKDEEILHNRLEERQGQSELKAAGSRVVSALRRLRAALGEAEKSGGGDV